MPKNKKEKEDSDTSDSGPEDREPKKPKFAEAATSKPKKKKDDEEPTFTLSKYRFVKVRDFKGKTYVDIREFYEKNDELLPGKKGISLSLDQWEKLKSFISEIDDAINNS